MKLITAIILAFAFSPALSYSAQEPGNNLYVLSGTVNVTQGKNPTHQVIQSERIASDTVVSTGDNSSALLKFEDGQVVTLQENSTFQIRQYRYDAANIENCNIIFVAVNGGMRFSSGLIGKQNDKAFKLLTSNATIRSGEADFMVVKTTRSIYSQVISGDIRISNKAGTAVLNLGESTVVTSPTSLAAVAAASIIPAGIFKTLLAIPTDYSAPIVKVAEPVPPVAPVPAVVPIVEAKKEPPVIPPKVKEQSIKATGEKSGKSLTGKIGTLGYGAELNFGFSDYISARVGLNTYTYKLNANSSLINYDFKWQLKTASAVADWYPFGGGFRTSAGLFYNDNKMDYEANPTGGNYDINGVTYTTADIGTLQGTISFIKASPYIGIGWGNPVAKNSSWGLVTDIGLLYQGSPKVNLEVTCINPAVCTQLQTDAAAERTKLQNDLKSFQWWPVASFGIYYQW